MLSSLSRARVAVFAASSLLLFTAGASRAMAAKTLILSCTEVAGSSWSPNQGGAHMLTAPFTTPHSVVIDLDTKKVFLDTLDTGNLEAPNNPALGDVVLTVMNPLFITVTNAPSLDKPHADAVTRFTFTINRRTGVLTEVDEVLLRDNTVNSATESIRVCGTDKPKF